MTSKGLSRREFVGYGAGATGGLALVLGACSDDDEGGGGGGDAADATTTTNARGLPELEGIEVVTDPDDFPAELTERPEFAARVRAGELDPVAERIGRDPLVIRPVHSVGRYGGTLRRAYTSVGDFLNASVFFGGPDNLLYWDYRREDVVPNIARDLEMSDDFTELVLHLRRGMRWSDGEPFTADDIVWWRNELSLNSQIGAPPNELVVNGQQVRVEKVDDYTVRYTAPAPHPLLPQLMASLTRIGGATSEGQSAGGGFAPMHYLQQFHPSSVGEAEANRLASGAGFDSWVPFLRDRNSWHLNVDLPTLAPWILTRPINNPPFEFAPNPYSIWVDTDGQQLPYLDQLSMNLAGDSQVIVLQITNGEIDYQESRDFTLESMPVLIENQESGGYEVHQNPSARMDFGIRFNLAYAADPEIGELIRTVEFRRALSLGLDRDQINTAFFLDTSIPSATMCADDSPYFPGREWRTRWATHDVDQANQLLDDLGLAARDGDGFRLRPDGSGRLRLDYQANAGTSDFPRIGEMVKQQWIDIGIDVAVSEVAPNLLLQRTLANELMLQGHQVGTDDPFLQPAVFLPTVTNANPGMIGIPYALWFTTRGAQGVEPPPSLALLKDAMEMYYEGLQGSDEDRIELGRELYMLHADQVWSIGGVGFGLSAGSAIHCVKSTLRNVPQRILSTFILKSPTNTYPMQFYYEE